MCIARFGLPVLASIYHSLSVAGEKKGGGEIRTTGTAADRARLAVAMPAERASIAATTKVGTMLRGKGGVRGGEEKRMRKERRRRKE